MTEDDFHPSSFILPPLKEAQVAIVGLGLMGGSLGLALKQRQLCRQVVGLVRRNEAAREAEAVGVADFATTDPAQALPDADLIVFSTPVRTIIRQLGEWTSLYKPGAIITDMGSTKQAVVQAMAELPPGVHPVGSHPMCGKEQAGLEAAEATLYQGAPWIVTPLERTPPGATDLIFDLAEAVGAKPRLLAADRHDKLVAAISHLPHALATALVLAAQQVAEDDPAVWEVAASGFRDTSRVAASDVTMMLDILLTNRAAVGQMVALAQAQLAQLVEALASENEPALRELLERASQQRKSMYNK
ncbi:MAG: prephenate dehydrogenase/arogenate dehydrogenase family protein [Anaerolineae bacterium]|nr:prephenate dehydrogenase/arogenate dehydrogenase family protein [Anaerolineae bacterium]